MKGEGQFAELPAQALRTHLQAAGLERGWTQTVLDTTKFRRPEPRRGTCSKSIIR